MTEYHDKFRDAELFDRLDRGEEIIGGLSEDQAKFLEQKKPNQLARLEALLPALRERIEGADPLCITEELLGRTRDSLVTVTDGLNSFTESGGVQGLNGIRNWTEAMAKLIGEWPGPSSLSPDDVSAITARFRRSAGQQLGQLSAEFEAVKKEIAGAQSNAEGQLHGIDEKRQNADAQLSELQDTIQQQRQRLDEAVERHQQQFSEAQERRVEEFRKEIAQAEAAAAEIKDQAASWFSATVNLTESQTDELIEDMKRVKAQAEEIAGVIGATGTSSGYREEADSQQLVANWLRVAAVVFGLAAAGLAIWAIVHAQRSADASLSLTLTKAIGSLVFVGIAGYLATQSGHHRLREEQARRRQLDLIALPPFIAALPDEEKDEITGRLAGQIFASPASTTAGQQEAALTKESISLVNLLLDAVRR